MSLDQVPAFLREHYKIHQWRHAVAILQGDFPEEWQNIVDVLGAFRLRKSALVTPGGRKTEDIAGWLDGQFYKRGWAEKKFDTKVLVDGLELESKTHKVDCFKNRIALEIEWNSKDSVFDRDLNGFRLLFELQAISVGIIVTRSSELQRILDWVERGSSYGATTTYLSKLLPGIKGGGGGGCPLLVFSITDEPL